MTAQTLIPMTCRDCGREFWAMGRWQTRCRQCYVAFKAAPVAPADAGPWEELATVSERDHLLFEARMERRFLDADRRAFEAARGAFEEGRLALLDELASAKAALSKARAEHDGLARAAQSELGRLTAERDAAIAEADQWRKLASSPKPGKARIPPEHWRRLVQLVHPDRHDNSDAANAAMKWLNEVRP